ncbi:MAG: hypothetical protein ABI830_13415 [Pseudolabrys sp.]
MPLRGALIVAAILACCGAASAADDKALLVPPKEPPAKGAPVLNGYALDFKAEPNKQLSPAPPPGMSGQQEPDKPFLGLTLTKPLGK